MNIGGLPVEGTAVIALSFLGAVFVITLGLVGFLIVKMSARAK